MEVKIAGVSLYYIINWFFIYSFLGWVWESCYVSAKAKKIINRGFINGPLCTIYGFGAISVYLILKDFDENILILYFGGVIVATVLEYITGWLMEAIFHTRWWDYSKKPFNLQGYICLGSSIAWGAFTVLLFYVFQPVVGDLVEMVPRKTGIVLVYVWLAGYTVDFAFSAAAAFDLRNKMKKLDVVWDEFQENLRDTKLYEVAEEARAKAEVYRMELPVGKWNDMIEERKKLFRETVERYSANDSRLLETKDNILGKYEEFVQKYGDVKKSIRHISRRHLRAYPNMVSSFERRRRLTLKKNRKQNKKSA